jgi:hypothetical protein
VEREVQSSRKIHSMNSSVRTKIEKFIDSHGAELVLKVTRKRKHQAISSSTSKEKMVSPSSVVSEDVSRYPKSNLSSEQQPSPTPLSQKSQTKSEDNADTSDGHWNYDDDELMSPSLKRRALSSMTDDDAHSEDKKIDSTHSSSGGDHPNDVSETANPAASTDKPSPSSNKDDGYYYSRRSRADSPPYNSSRDKLYGESSRYSSSSAGEYVRPGYTRPPHYSSYTSSSHYRYPPPSSGPYYRSSSSRYYSSNSGSRRSSPPPYYHRPSASSSRRGSLSDDEMDRRRWD